ncbi:RlpA-like double-psi beta-barrel-protein domain-containing protein-containing protein [Multifurca ochricompacta]|uniref:RlpA-like double-psi beta-barrel-protein domain-containing protein-containing protein n=1 Tax=Multifurca ochricompacta TaxID=376703 RepID=A0AAD4QN48_9AGAM|nr:RlpA-like double-psi beta-barrel-protein domain-containing protein-containing protein [Multifurca ochricompacta]
MFFSIIILLIFPHFVCATKWIEYTDSGFATMTHYTLPQDYIASCGCTGQSTHFPTAALNQMAFGSSTAYGPSCGRCFRLTLLNTFLSDPPFYPSVTKSIIVKVTDLCPLSTTGWCNATASGPNAGGTYLNFDLAFPSSSIPDNFFPSNVTLYDCTPAQDFGVWNISYQSVSCSSHWSGFKDTAALGSVPDLGDSVCCPANPMGNANDTCPSFSDQSGIPPNTTTSAASSRLGVLTLLGWVTALLIPLMYISPF